MEPNTWADVQFHDLSHSAKGLEGIPEPIGGILFYEGRAAHLTKKTISRLEPVFAVLHTPDQEDHLLFLVLRCSRRLLRCPGDAVVQADYIEWFFEYEFGDDFINNPLPPPNNRDYCVDMLGTVPDVEEVDRSPTNT